MKRLDKKAVWMFFFRGLSVWFIILIYFIVSIIGIFEEDSYTESIFNSGRWFIPIVLLVLLYVWAKLSFHYYKYELSDMVFKKEHGIIWKKYVSIPYDRIQNVDIHRGIIARILGLSDVQIQTAGGISSGSYGAFSEGRLMGVSKEEAERIRDELIMKSRQSRTGQGL